MAVVDNAFRQCGAALVDVEVLFEAVVDVTERALTTTVADPALDRVRGFEEQAELHLAVAIERMHKSVIGERATRVEVDGMAAAAISRVPDPITQLLAAVAQVWRVTGHPLQLVLLLGAMGDLGH